MDERINCDEILYDAFQKQPGQMSEGWNETNVF